MSDTAIDLIKDKSPAWVHGVSKKELIEFLEKFNPEPIYNFFLLDELKKISKKGGIEKTDKCNKEGIIQVLTEYKFTAVLEITDIDVLRRVTKEVIEDIRYKEFQKLATKTSTSTKNSETEEKSKKSSEVQTEVSEAGGSTETTINSSEIINKIVETSDDMGQTE